MSVTMVLEYNIVEQVIDQVREAAAAAVEKTALDVLSDANQSMEGIKSGRQYTRGGKLHIASAPGEPPAVDTGNLRASGYTSKAGELEWEVGYTAEYAEILEGASGLYEQGGVLDMMTVLGVLDTMPSNAVAPRPFLRPAVTRQSDAFYKAMQKVAG